MIYEASRILRLHAIRANVKGGFVSECFSNWRKSKKNPLALSTQQKDAQGSDLSPIFGDLSQSENNSEIKTPLVLFKCLRGHSITT